jgi:hypothetical protein
VAGGFVVGATRVLVVFAVGVTCVLVVFAVVFLVVVFTAAVVVTRTGALVTVLMGAVVAGTVTSPRAFAEVVIGGVLELVSMVSASAVEVVSNGTDEGEDPQATRPSAAIAETATIDMRMRHTPAEPGGSVGESG